MLLPKSVYPLMMSFTLTACSAVVTTPFQSPQTDIPSHFQQQNTANSSSVTAAVYADQWWTLFQDQQLNQLVQQVLARNGDLAKAGLNLQIAREQAGLAQNQQGLRIGSATIGSGHQYQLGNGKDSDNGLSASANVSYVVDLFGKLAKQTDAARWEALADEQDLQATAQTLIATTCNLYWQLGYLHQSVQTAQTNVAASRKLLQLVQVQYRAGAVSGLELTQAQQAVQSQLANLSQLQQQLVETRTALAVLLQMPVQQLDIQEPQQLPHITLPTIDAGLPADILSRRPDLKAAELRLRKALASKDATKAGYYPSISLTGALGMSSTSLTQLLKNPVLTLGAGLNLPFLQYNDMQRNLKISELEYQSAIIDYRKTLYQAFADVENALSNRNELDKQVKQQQQTLALTEKTARLYDIQYRSGAVALKEVLDAQADVRNAQVNLSKTLYNQYNSYVTLMQALGGSPIKSLP